MCIVSGFCDVGVCRVKFYLFYGREIILCCFEGRIDFYGCRLLRGW